jgi:hypothetical protein
MRASCGIVRNSAGTLSAFDQRHAGSLKEQGNKINPINCCPEQQPCGVQVVERVGLVAKYFSDHYDSSSKTY